MASGPITAPRHRLAKPASRIPEVARVGRRGADGVRRYAPAAAGQLEHGDGDEHARHDQAGDAPPPRRLVEPAASGRSSHRTSRSSCSSARKPNATIDTGMPIAPHITSSRSTRGAAGRRPASARRARRDGTGRVRSAGDRLPPGRLRHDDLHRDVGARRAHGRGQPRPGVPGRGRARRGARRGRGGAARGPQPVRAAGRRAGAARRDRRAPGAFYGLEVDGRAGHLRRDRGDRRGDARPARAGRRGGRLRAAVRLVRPSIAMAGAGGGS